LQQKSHGTNKGNETGFSTCSRTLAEADSALHSYASHCVDADPELKRVMECHDRLRLLLDELFGELQQLFDRLVVCVPGVPTIPRIQCEKWNRVLTRYFRSGASGQRTTQSATEDGGGLSPSTPPSTPSSTRVDSTDEAVGHGDESELPALAPLEVPDFDFRLLAAAGDPFAGGSS